MRYISYFLYCWWHWGLRLACFVIWHEITGERKYGIRTTGTDGLKGVVSEEDRDFITMYEPINYYSAERLFAELQPEDRQAGFLDVGCGKGRVLAIAAVEGFKEIHGVEFAPALCSASAAVKDDLEARFPGVSVTINCIDARYYSIPESVGVIFLFNPFNDRIMTTFIQQVMETLQRKERPLKILYANPVSKELWLEAGFKETASFVKMSFLQGSVLERVVS